MARLKVVVTGAAGYIASQLLPAFRERYDLVLLDNREHTRDGALVEGVTLPTSAIRTERRIAAFSLELMPSCTWPSIASRGDR